MITKTNSIVFALVAIVAVGSIGLISSSMSENQTEDIPEVTLDFNQDFLERDGIRSVVTIVHSESVDVTRGNSVITSLTLTHEANDAKAKSVTLEPRGTIGVITPEPYASMYTSEERSQQLRENGEITGSISLSDYVSYSPSQVTIAPGESVVVSMMIDIPDDFDERLMVGKLPFQPNFVKIGDYPEQQIRIDNAIVDVQVTERSQ
ncbi:hypothetical protein [Nitrosopumilus sp.]|uniref:hypothetical protein n=1 Tax=Nitrosopumilus sp. TaxID=2024843 RepID=UPI0034A08351